jgi:hypothetical protein
MGHLTKWLFFNLMFGAIPYGLTVLLNRTQSPGSPLLHPSSEVLFIAVVATSSSLGELWDEDEYGSRPRSHWRARWQLLLLLGVLCSSLLYGAYVYATLGEPGRGGGVDCSVIAAWALRPGSPTPDPWQAQLMAQWASPCAAWARSQATLFRWSLWTVAVWVPIGTTAMHLYPPRRR